jgi:hypothetical protein
VSKWFGANGLSLNIDKNSVIKLNLSHFQEDSLQIFYRDKLLKEVTNVRFLGLGIDKHLNWKTHIEQVIPKVSTACYAVRSMFHFSTKDSLRMIYFAYFHSIMKYGIIFWGSHSDSNRVFRLQKKVIRIMTGSKSRIQCKPLFKALEIMTLLQYILSLMTSMIYNLEYFTFNSSVHSFNTRTRKKVKLYKPIPSSASFQRGAYYASTKIFNKLPVRIAQLVMDKKRFISVLKGFLITQAFYSVMNFLITRMRCLFNIEGLVCVFKHSISYLINKSLDP